MNVETALNAGKIAFAGAESGVLACVRADLKTGAESLERFRAVLPHAPVPARLVWLVAAPATALEAMGSDSVSRSHTRLIERLAPGPAVFVVELPSRSARETYSRARIWPQNGDPNTLAFRVPGDSPAASLAHRTREPLVCIEVNDESGRVMDHVQSAADLARSLGVESDALLDDGPPANRHGATVILLRRGIARPEILRTGAYEERYILKHMTLNVLFVCTGNTCRSPMAEVIASGLAERLAPGIDVRFSSAGVGAGSGHPATPEAVESLRELGFKPGRHRSRPVTPELVREADVILTMTRSQLDSVVRSFRDASRKAEVLDPNGADVPDPIGSAQSVYTDTARRLVVLITKRLEEFRS